MVVLFAGLLPMAAAVATPEFGTPGMWTGKFDKETYIVQTTVNENTLLTFVCEPDSGVDLVFFANGLDYSDDFSLFIDGKSMENRFPTIKEAKTLQVVYGNGKKVNLPTKNAEAVLGRCIQTEFKDDFFKYCKDINEGKVFEGSSSYRCFYPNKNLTEAYSMVKSMDNDFLLKEIITPMKNLKYSKNKDDITYQWSAKNELTVIVDKEGHGEITTYLFKEQRKGTKLTIQVDTAY